MERELNEGPVFPFRSGNPALARTSTPCPTPTHLWLDRRFPSRALVCGVGVARLGVASLGMADRDGARADEESPGFRWSEAGSCGDAVLPPILRFTPARRAHFAEVLSRHGNVRLACAALRISPETAYKARRRDGAFAAAWDAALVLALRHAEAVLADRALNGVEEAVFYHGEEVARRRYDSRLLLAHIARLDARAADAAQAGLAARFDEQLALMLGEEPGAALAAAPGTLPPLPGDGKPDPRAEQREDWQARAEAQVDGLEDRSVTPLPAGEGQGEGQSDGDSGALPLEFKSVDAARDGCGAGARAGRAPGFSPEPCPPCPLPAGRAGSAAISRRQGSSA